jgi:hypothetical protein
MMIQKMMLAAALAVGTMTVAQAPMQAQMGAVNAPSGPVDPAKSLDAALTGFEEECMGVAKTMPSEKYNFSPASLNIPGAKYGDVMTFVQEVRHIAQANYSYFARAGAMQPDVDVKAIGNITNKDEAVKALAGSFAFGHRAIATITAANAWEPVKGMGPTGTRAASAYGAVAHGFDHYGQLVEYLRMNGLVPPASAK